MYYICIVIFTKVVIISDMETKKEIKVTPEIRVELLKEFPVSEKTVYNALNFATGGYTAEQIRRRAQELGGKLMQEVVEDGEHEAEPSQSQDR